LAVVISGGGATVASANDANFTAIGENNIYFLLLSSANHNLWAGQGFLIGSLQGLFPSNWLISDLRAYTAPAGSSIAEKTWTKDTDPYFTWRVEIKPPTFLKEFWVSLDTPPTGSTASDRPAYQFPEGSVSTGQHAFYVLPVGYTQEPDPTTILKYEIWVDRTVPSLNQVSPSAGSIINNASTPVSCVAADSDSGMDVSTTTLTINGSSAAFEYDGKTSVLTTGSKVALSEGKNTVMVKAVDNVGNSVTRGWDFIVDTQPPSGTITINAGQEITHSAHVVITADVTDLITQIRNTYLSNDGVFDTEMQHPIGYQSRIADWLLSEPDVDGPKTVYAKFQDAAGNISQTFTASIILKRLTPDTRIVSGPNTSTDKKDADFAFEASRLGCKFSYKIDTQGWTDWQAVTAVHLGGLSLGNHYFYVKSGYDLNGDDKITIDEEDATPAQWVWTIETTDIIEKVKQKILFWRR
jgi:hypothetical protein